MKPLCLLCGHGQTAHEHFRLDDLPSRFTSKVEVDEASGCWLWTAARNEDGYGVFQVHPRLVRAHRWAYIQLVGDPGPLSLDHLCRVRNCVNPAHLEPVTNAENTRRGLAPSVVVRRNGVCPKGHVLTDDTVLRGTDGRRRCLVCHRAWDRNVKRRLRAAQVPSACAACGAVKKLASRGICWPCYNATVRPGYDIGRQRRRTA